MFDAKSNRHQFVLFAFLLALTFVLLPSLASAQTVTGYLQGTVYDSKGAVVPGVEIVVRNLETGQERNVRTNDDGIYVASFLPLGRYSIKASGQGFTDLTQDNVEITLNQTRVADSLIPAESLER